MLHVLVVQTRVEADVLVNVIVAVIQDVPAVQMVVTHNVLDVLGAPVLVEEAVSADVQVHVEDALDAVQAVVQIA